MIVCVPKAAGTVLHVNEQVRINGIVQVKRSPPFRPVRVGPEDDHAVLVRSQKYLSIAIASGNAPLPRPDGDGWRRAALGERVAGKHSIAATHRWIRLLSRLLSRSLSKGNLQRIRNYRIQAARLRELRLWLQNCSCPSTYILVLFSFGCNPN